MANPWTDSDAYAREAAKVESAGEALLLTLLWWRRDGWTVRAQHPVEQYRIDLFVPEVGVAIEVDSFGGHGSAKDMERDARKRNLVVTNGWVPLTFSAQQAVFHPHDALAEMLSVIASRLAPARRSAPSSPRWADPLTAAHGRGLLSALDGIPAPIVVSASQVGRFDRAERDAQARDLLGLCISCPSLLGSSAVAAALGSADAAITDASRALLRNMSAGVIDQGAFLADCPAVLRDFAVGHLATPLRADDTLRSQVRELVAELAPMAQRAEDAARASKLLQSLAAPPPVGAPAIRRRGA